MQEVFVVLLWSLTGVISRDTKPVKPMPAITNSLVNFGKMDISFYLNDKFKDVLTKQKSFQGPSSSLFFSEHDSQVEESCPCSNLRSMKDPILTHPSEILDKILMSNNLFSYNKELISSTLCCDSHENIHDEGIFFEFSPKQNQVLSNPMHANQLLLPSLTRVLEKVFPRTSTLSTEPLKSQVIDFYLFPKKKMSPSENNNILLKKKPDVHAVGDNVIKDDIKTINLTPVASNKSSVKKDLGKKKVVEEKVPVSANIIVKASTNYAKTV